MVETDTLQEQIAARLAAVREGVAVAVSRAGRPAGAVTLIAVSKTMDAATVRAAARAGVADVGENKVQEAAAKIAALAALPLRWHLIGHLQGNKAKRAAELFDTIHTVDSVGAGHGALPPCGSAGAATGGVRAGEREWGGHEGGV